MVNLESRPEARVDTSLPTLDGYVAAIVAGPVSISPLDRICPLLAIDADAFRLRAHDRHVIAAFRSAHCHI